MLLDPLAEQGTPSVGQRLRIDVPDHGAPASQPLLPDHPGLQGTLDVLRHAGRASMFGSGPEPCGDASMGNGCVPLRTPRAMHAQLVAADERTA
jgi:hypothetical protein